MIKRDKLRETIAIEATTGSETMEALRRELFEAAQENKSTEVRKMRTEGQKRLDRSWASVQETLKDVIAIDSRCDVLISEIRKPMKSFHVWLFDGLCGRGFQVK